MILRRVNTRDGRKTAWVNDRRASGEVLRRLSETLVELHGQHDDRGLLNPRGHRQLLDLFAESPVAEVRRAWQALARARSELADAQAALAEVQAEEDFLRHAVAELDALDPQPAEEAELDTARRRMQAAERIRKDIARAHEVLGTGGAEPMLSDAARWLEGASDVAEGGLDDALAALMRAQDALAEAEQGVAAFLDSLDFDPGALELAEERLFALRALARKHGVLPDALPGLSEVLHGRLTQLDNGAGDIQQLEKAVAAALAAYDAAASDLTETRKAAAARLDAAMAAELAPLKMERAVFATIVEPAEPGPDGKDAVTFTVATNPGAPAGALDRIASGGELSRFLLALKVCLTSGTSGLTLIFDEIDRGVGGATADAVGRRLAGLAEDAQVLVVTHSPQVAARGGHHWRVEKRVVGDVTTSHVAALDEGERIDEIARMLSGDVITDAARSAARALLPESRAAG